MATHWMQPPLAGTVDYSTVEARVLAYVERVTGKVGQAAVDQWCRYTGYDDNGNRNRTPAQQLAQASYNALHRRFEPAV